MMERRKSYRIPLHADAVVRARRIAYRCTADDVSLGGAHLTHTPRLDRGTPIQLEIRPAGFDPVIATGEAWRIGADWIGVRFGALHPDAEDAVHDLSIALLEHGRRPGALVVECDRRRRARLAELLCRAGFDVTVACTPLETVAALQDPLSHIRAAIVDLDLTQTSGLEVLRYLAVEHPDIRRVAVARCRGRGDADRRVAARYAHRIVCEPLCGRHVAAAVRERRRRAPAAVRAASRPPARLR